MDLEHKTVIPLASLGEPTRRDFCHVSAVGVAALVLGACDSGGRTGAVIEPDDGGSSDGADDDMRAAPDLTSGATCPPNVTDTGMAPSAFALDTATYFSGDSLFVCRDAQGLYAITAICTHQGCPVRFQTSASGFFCPCHGSRFSFGGAVTAGPARSPLVHYALCLSAGGNVTYDPNTVVGSSQRLHA